MIDRPFEASHSAEASVLESVVWDALVVGTGMSGATLGYALARVGKRVLLIEKGRDLRFGIANVVRGKTAEEDEGFRKLTGAELRATLESHGRYADQLENAEDHSTFVPHIGSGTGGSSSLYGMTLERFFPSDFEPRARHVEGCDSSLPERWPVSYEQLQPFYAEAERLYRVRGERDPLRPDAGAHELLPPSPVRAETTALMAHLASRGVHPYRLHLACEGVEDCQSCQGYLCPHACKNDATRICVAPAVDEHGARLLTECEVLGLEGDRTAVRRVHCSLRGRKLALRARVVVLAAGALNTPALLLRSRSPTWPGGLANGSGLVGCNLMRHCIELWVLRSAPPLVHLRDSKAIGFNDFYVHDGQKLGTVQSFGAAPPLTYLQNQSTLNPWRLLGPLSSAVWRRYSRAPILASILEDLPYPANRIELRGAEASDRGLMIRYRTGESEAGRKRIFRSELRRVFRGLGTILASGTDAPRALGHVCGTCRFGDDPASSVLDSTNRAHELDNLYVVDASFFPSSSGMNPALTLAANALRVARHIAQRI